MAGQRVIFLVWAAVGCIWIHLDAATAASCASRVAIGDQGVGISAIEDPSCKNGGVGCFSDGICRFCQMWASPQSNHLVGCTSTATTPASIPPPTSAAAPVATTRAPVPVIAPSDCYSIVKNSGLTGISFVSDRTCNVDRPTATGCSALTSCRLCRAAKNEGNQFLINCAVLQNVSPGTMRRATAVETPIDEEDAKPKKLTGTLFLCVGAMALVIAVIGLAHAQICHRDNSQDDCAVDDTGLASKTSEEHSVVAVKS